MTPANLKRNTGFKMLLSTACVFIVIGGLKAAGYFLVPVVLGFFLALISLPITGWLRKHRFPGPLAVLTTVGLEALVITGVVFLIVSIMPDFQASTEKYQETLKTMAVERAGEFQDSLNQKFLAVQKMLNIPDLTPETETPGDTPAPGFDLRVAVDRLLSVESMLSVVKWVGDTAAIQRLAAFVAKTFIAFIIMIFVLVESGRFAEKLPLMTRVKGPSFDGFRNAGDDLQRYLGIKTAVSLTTGVLAWLACMIFGVEFPVIWGLVAFLLNYIPTIGSIVAAVPPVLVALVQLGPWQGFGIGLCYVGINGLLGNFIEPVLLGHRFGLSTVMVLFSVLFWGFIWGPVGMFLAVPLTMMIKIMMDQSDDFRWISLLISKDASSQFAEEAAHAAHAAHAPEAPPPAKELDLELELELEPEALPSRTSEGAA